MLSQLAFIDCSGWYARERDSLAWGVCHSFCLLICVPILLAFLLCSLTPQRNQEVWSYNIFTCVLRLVLGIIYQSKRENNAVPTKQFMCPALEPVCILLYITWQNWLYRWDLCKVLRWGDHPGVSEWTSVSSQESVRVEGGETQEEHETEMWLWKNEKKWRKWAWAQECRQPLERGRGKEWDSPWELPEKNTVLST